MSLIDKRIGRIRDLITNVLDVSKSSNINHYSVLENTVNIPGNADYYSDHITLEAGNYDLLFLYEQGSVPDRSIFIDGSETPLDTDNPVLINEDGDRWYRNDLTITKEEQGKLVNVKIGSNSSGTKYLKKIFFVPMPQYDFLPEIVRPKHTIIATKAPTIDANSSANTDELIGTDNPYRTSGNWFDVAEFSFIYFVLYRAPGDTDSGALRLTYEFGVRTHPPKADIISRSSYIGNQESSSVPGPRGIEAIATEAPGEVTAESEWIEVKGNSCRINLYNDDDFQHDFRVAVMGIR